MDTYDFVQLAFLAVGGEIQGKTKIQKTVYFLGILTGEIGNVAIGRPGFGYGPHFYGPYSSEVAGAVGQLHALGFLDRQIVQTGVTDPQGFEVKRYDFSFTKVGRRVANTKAERLREPWNKLQQAADVLRTAGDIDYMKMSIAAKAYFMLGARGGSATTGDLAELAPRFGWNVSRDQIREAAAYLNKLGLAK